MSKYIKVWPCGYYGPPSALFEVFVDDDDYLLSTCSLPFDHISLDKNIKIDRRKLLSKRDRELYDQWISNKLTI